MPIPLAGIFESSFAKLQSSGQENAIFKKATKGNSFVKVFMCGSEE